MGTTSEKLTYLNVTKQKLKQAINNIGGEVTDETTFRNYVAELENAYDRLPKTEFEEGESVTLENTLKGKLDYDNGVVGIGQSSQETTTGKNLLKSPYTTTQTSTNNIKLTIEEDMKIKLTGTANADGGVIAILQNPITLNANTTYTFSIGTGTKQTGWGFYLQNSNSVNLYYIGVSSTSSYVTFTPTSDVVVAKTSLHFVNGTTMNTTIYLQLEQGSSATSYEPYTGGQASPNPSYPQTINSVTGNQDVVVSGKNLLEAKLNTVTNNGITVTNNNDGTFTINGTNTSTSVVTFRLDEPNFHTYEDGTYTLDKGTTNTDIFIRLMQNETWAQIITVSYDERLKSQAITNATNTFIYIGIKGSATINNVTIKPMFVKGSYTVETIGNFEPYITPKTYQLSLGDIELNSIGNYKDELIYDVDEDKVYKNEKIEKKIFTGANTETWSMYGETNNYRFFTTDIANIIKPSTQILCNYYKGSTSTGDLFVNGYVVNPASGNISFYNSDILSTDNFKAWLSTHNTEVRYILATPIETEITDTTLHQQVKALYNAHSNNGTTIITSNGNLPMIIKVRGLKGE